MVIERVASLEGVDPLQFEVPLNDAVDPDAPDSLFGGPDAVSGHVVFEYCGYEVFAASDGRISVGDVAEGPLDPTESLQRHTSEAPSPPSENRTR